MKSILVPFTTSPAAPKSWLLLKVPVQPNNQPGLRPTSNATPIQLRMTNNQQQLRPLFAPNLNPAPMMLLNNLLLRPSTPSPSFNLPNLIQSQPTPSPLFTLPNVIQTQSGMLNNRFVSPMVNNIQFSPTLTTVNPPSTQSGMLNNRFVSPMVNNIQFRPTLTTVNPPSKTATSSLPMNKKGPTKIIVSKQIQARTYINPFDYSAEFNFKYKYPDVELTEQKNTEKHITWLCLLCSEKKDDKEALLEHYAWHKRQRESLEQQENALETQLYIKCPVCSRTSTDVRSYNIHVYAFHKPREFYCNLCKTGFLSAVHLSKHNIRHAPDKQTIICAMCKKYSTKSMIMLIEHVHKRHRQKVYHCDYCKKQFYSKMWFKDHKQFHLKTNAFNCKYCGQQFDNQRSIIGHIKKSHPMDSSKLKKYKCDECNMTFPLPENFQKHMENIHVLSNKIYRCGTCAKEFTNLNSMKRHEILHTKDRKTCNICQKYFGTNYSLNQHMVTHTGKRPYKCSDCEKSFTQSSTLKIHMRIHTGERPYVCSHCERGFTSKSSKDCHEKSCKSRKK